MYFRATILVQAYFDSFVTEAVGSLHTSISINLFIPTYAKWLFEVLQVFGM